MPAATPGVASATEQTAAANEVDPKAIDALKKMSAYLRTLKSYTVHSEATKDEFLESGQNIQFNNTVDIYAKLPNRLRVDVNSDRKQRRIYYDGKTVTQYAPRINYYASVAAPGTIRETLKLAADNYDLDVPLADLFFWGTDQSGIEDINSAIDVGPSRIGGVECDHFAFRQEGADWQIWIERGKAPLPRKLVITTMDEPSQPQYSSLLRWDLKASVEDKTFTFDGHSPLLLGNHRLRPVRRLWRTACRALGICGGTSMMLHEHLPMLAKFVILLTGILLLPRLMERLRLPGVLGYILAGVLIGPPLLGVVQASSVTINFFAEIGKLLFMFFVGFEVDMEQFNKARKRCLTFGALTFVFPFVGGLFLARLTGYEWNASVLIGSVIASHTLLGFPLLARLGLVKRESVLVAVGGTIITDIAAMMVLAVTISIHQIGFSWQFLLIELLELAVLVPLIIFGLSKLSRKAVLRYGQTPEARMVIFMMVIAVAAELGQMIHLEGIVGAFLAGIAVKRSFRGKFALEQLEVIAQSLFIPAFFVSTGFLVNFALLGNTIAGQILTQRYGNRIGSQAAGAALQPPA